jgi:hypothetical protein
MSALVHKRTPAPQQNESLFDHLIRKLLQMQWQVEAQRLSGLEIDGSAQTLSALGSGGRQASRP